MSAPISIVVEVGSLRSREDVERFVALCKALEERAEPEKERARMLGKIKNSRTDVRGGK